MASKKIRFLVEKKNRDGTIRRYWQPPKSLAQAGWPTVPLRHKETGAWLNELDAIVACDRLNRELDEWRTGGNIPATGQTNTLDLLIDLYEKSPRYAKLAPRTKKEYRNNFRQLSKWAGDQPVTGLTPALVQAYYEAGYKRAPSVANAQIRHLSLLLNYGIKIGMVQTNAAAKPDLIDEKKKARIWSPEEVAHMVATADAMALPSLAVLILLGEWTGQYPADLLPARADQWDHRTNKFHMARTKTGERVIIPLNEEIARRLRAQLMRHQAMNPQPMHLITSERTKRAYTQSHFNERFQKLRAEAAATMPACADLTFRTLRHTCVVRMAEKGCTTSEIASITAHSLRHCDAIVDRYLVRSEQLAENAMRKREGA